MTTGVTSSGFVAPTVLELQDDINAKLQANVDATLDTSPTEPLGQIVGIFAGKLAEVWELGATAYNGTNPNAAEGALLDFVCAITGTKRLGATYSRAHCTVNLNATTTLPQGAEANVTGQPTNTWTLLGPADANGNLLSEGPVVSTTAGTYHAIFQSTTTGPNVANAGTLTVITAPVTGWNSITNPSDAVLGGNVEQDVDLRVRREAELAAAGGSTSDGMRADLLAVPGVIQAFVFENDSDATDANGVPPHAIHVVIYDGASPSASNADIAAAIWKDKPAGAATYGSISANVTDSQGVVRTVYFDRAIPVPLYLAFTATTDTTYDAVNGPGAVKAAVVARAAKLLNLGVSVISLQYEAAALSVHGVTDVTALKIDTVNPPVATGNFAISGLQIATMDTTRITVNGV